MSDRSTGIAKATKGLFVAILATMAVSAQASQRKFQFDIICPIRGRLIVDNDADLNKEPGHLGPAEWSRTSRYAIDLRRGRYLDVGGKEAIVEQFARATKSRFWFTEDADGFERFNLRTNRFYGRGKVGNWLISIETSHCRRAKFSGFR
jgi:hypothetical protein